MTPQDQSFTRAIQLLTAKLSAGFAVTLTAVLLLPPDLTKIAMLFVFATFMWGGLGYAKLAQDYKDVESKRMDMRSEAMGWAVFLLIVLVISFAASQGFDWNPFRALYLGLAAACAFNAVHCYRRYLNLGDA